jgi:hypothetical protein
MKIILYSSLLVAIFSTACSTANQTSKNDKMNQTGIPLAPEIFKSRIERSLSNLEGKDTIVSSIDYEFYATPKSPWQDSINHFIGDFMHATSALESEKRHYEILTHEYFYNALSQFEENFKSVRNTSESQAVWFYESSVTIDDHLQNFGQVKAQASFYTGGAHPNTSIMSSVISKKDATTLKLADLTTDVSKFNKIAENHFRKARELSKTDDLKTDFWFENGIFACNDNFYVDSNGITFTFNAYEVAPYYFGTTTFTVPLNEVKDILKVKF